jgi:hypothetical protein
MFAVRDRLILGDHRMGDHQLPDHVDQTIEPIGAYAYRRVTYRLPGVRNLPLGPEALRDIGGFGLSRADEGFADPLTGFAGDDLFHLFTLEFALADQEISESRSRIRRFRFIRDPGILRVAEYSQA